MDKLKKKMIERIATDDAKWDNCFADLASLGFKINTTFTAYDPPKDPKDKLEYDSQWNKAKERSGIDNAS